MRYIELEAAVTAVDESLCWRNSDDWYEHASVIEKNLRAIPAVDAVEVRHAHWNKRVDNSGKFRYVEWYCTACRAKVQTGQPRFAGSYIEHEPAYKYCPYCGARMDGRREDGDNDG